MTRNNLISKYRNTTLGKFLESSGTYYFTEIYLTTVHFLDQKNNLCNMAQFDLTKISSSFDTYLEDSLTYHFLMYIAIKHFWNWNNNCDIEQIGFENIIIPYLVNILEHFQSCYIVGKSTQKNIHSWTRRNLAVTGNSWISIS